MPPRITLLDVVHRAGLPLASGCGAQGMCGRCGVQILEGKEYLPSESPREREIKRANRIDPALRLSCALRPRGNLAITTAYW